MKKIQLTILKIFVGTIGFLTLSCGSDDTDIPTTDTETDPNSDSDDNNDSNNNVNPETPNILLIIADDMGLDATPGYTIGDGTIKPNMPNLQNMIANGVTFNNVWSNPTCSPTRAGILTGRHGFRTGVTSVGVDLPTSETSLQAYINQNTNNTYSQGVVGKWHLSSDPNHPTQLGIDYYAGSLGGGLPSYTNWNLTENGQTSTSTEYATTKYTDLAINWTKDQTKPWFLWLAYNAPHTPFHLPPANLHSQGNLPSDQASIAANPLPYYLAMIEAMDTEIGRLLESFSPEVRNNTMIIFVGDNGSPAMVVQEFNSRRSKGSVFQGGVNVPMIISGATVSRKATIENTLVNTLDLFATIADVAGSNTTEVNDSKSFKETFANANTLGKTYAYTEGGNSATSVNQAIRNATHKYISFSDGREFLYNLIENPLENPNLLDSNQAPLSESDSQIRDALIAELNRITVP